LGFAFFTGVFAGAMTKMLSSSVPAALEISISSIRWMTAR